LLGKELFKKIANKNDKKLIEPFIENEKIYRLWVL